MRAFETRIKTYADSFGLSRRDVARLRAHYPVFRLAHEAEYATGMRRRIARRLAQFFYGQTLSHQVQSPQGAFTLNIGFSPADLSSFCEVFWGRAYPALLPDASVFVDIGANTGMTACFFSTQYTLQRILAVEANPALEPTLRANTSSLPLRVDIETAAISDENGTTDFVVHENHRHSGIGVDAGVVCRVTTVTLRTMLDRHELTEVDILKLDIEGAEHRILAHDPSILSRVRCLLMETHFGRAARDELAQLVEAQGFCVHVQRGVDVDAVIAVRANGLGEAIRQRQP